MSTSVKAAMPSRDDLMALVGKYMCEWGALEQTLENELTALSPDRNNPPPAGCNFVARLGQWRDLRVQASGETNAELDDLQAQLNSARLLRHLLTHGIRGAHAARLAILEPRLHCRERVPSDKTVPTTWRKRDIGFSDLKAALRQLRRARAAIRQRPVAPEQSVALSPKKFSNHHVWPIERVVMVRDHDRGAASG